MKLKLLKYCLMLVVIFLGSALSVQAKPADGVDHTHEQKANEVREAFKDAIEQERIHLQSESVASNEDFEEVETDIASELDMQQKHVHDIIEQHKDAYVTAIEAEKQQMIERVLSDFEKDTKERIHEEVTDDITEFLQEETK